jgi:hypothetical protein
MKGLVKIAVGAGVVIAAAIAAVLLLRGRGEEAKVEALLRQAFEDGRVGDAGKCIGYLAEDYDSDGMNYEQVCALVRRYVGPGKWESVELRDLEAGVDGETAVATMNLWLQYSGMPKMPVKLTLQLKKTAAGWKISGHRVEGPRGRQ